MEERVDEGRSAGKETEESNELKNAAEEGKTKGRIYRD